jgi:hypothetical protein
MRGSGRRSGRASDEAAVPIADGGRASALSAGRTEPSRSASYRKPAPHVRKQRPSGQSGRANWWGTGAPDLKGVSGRNTPQGPGRSKPSRSRETTQADLRGGGSPRRGTAESSRREPRRHDRPTTDGESQRQGSGEHAAPGEGFPGLGAPEGRRTPREHGRDEGLAAVGRPGSADRNADEILEGERKSMSGIQPEG